MEGKASYGGRDQDNRLLSPNGNMLPIFLMNGNLVLIPAIVVRRIGIIDGTFSHSFGDWDYGCRALKKGFNVFLSTNFVGITERHDHDIEPFLNSKYRLHERINLLYSKKYSAIMSFLFCKRHLGVCKALRVFLIQNLYALCPRLYVFRKCTR